MKQFFAGFVWAVVLCAVVGCSTSSVSTVSSTDAQIAAGQIGMAPDGDELSDAIANELTAQGFDIAPSSKVRQIENLDALNQAGISTILIVKNTQGYDGAPESVNVKIISTKTGETIASVSWSNGYFGSSGKLLDRAVRSSVQSAAKDIANEISKKLSK